MLVILNPHTGIYGVNAGELKKNRTYILGTRKYEYVLDLIRERRVAIGFDGTTSSLPRDFVPNVRPIRYLITFFELLVWCWINRINPFRIKLFLRLNSLNPEKDRLYTLFGLGSTLMEEEKTHARSWLARFTGKKYVNVTHYFNKTALAGRNLAHCSNVAFVGEADVRTNSLFQKYMDAKAPFILIPFALRSRYQSRVPLLERQNRCLAIGSVDVLPINEWTKDYIEHFNSRVIHNFRKTLADLGDFCPESIENRMSYVNNRRATTEQQPTTRPSLTTKVLNRLQSLRTPPTYFTLDIVDLYNQYQMFVSPEENVGVPSINFAEGMACGCLYFGTLKAAYEALGLQDGIHYVWYDGSEEDLIRKIRELQKDPERRARIAQTGSLYIRERFARETIKTSLAELGLR